MHQKPKLQTAFFQLWSDVVLRGYGCYIGRIVHSMLCVTSINLREIIIFGFALECESSEC